MNGRITEKKTIGDIIRTLRKESGMSQTKLANESGISPYYVSKIERNVTNPSFNIVLRLLDALGYDLIEIISILPVGGG